MDFSFSSQRILVLHQLCSFTFAFSFSYWTSPSPIDLSYVFVLSSLIGEVIFILSLTIDLSFCLCSFLADQRSHLRSFLNDQSLLHLHSFLTNYRSQLCSFRTYHFSPSPRSFNHPPSGQDIQILYSPTKIASLESSILLRKALDHNPSLLLMSSSSSSS